MSVAAPINRVFSWEDRKYRVLKVDLESNIAWCIDIVDPHALPEPLPNSAVVERPVIVDKKVMPVDLPKRHRTLMDKAWKCVKQLIDKNTDDELFYPASRKKALERSQAYGCAESTMYGYLRRYWQRGMTPSALIPDFDKCGTPKAERDKDEDDTVTQKRGRSTEEGVAPYQMTQEDVGNMKDVIETYLHNNRRVKISDAYAEYLSKHFLFTDAQGQQRVRPVGERPSLRQFRYFYNANYNLETRLRAKFGDKHFKLNLREVFGVTGQDAPFAGYGYEIDSTIVPVTALAAHDRTFVVGKPTLYLVYDRKSKLIPGFYLGMEHASWVAAMVAIYSIAEDKAALCQRHGVEYDPADWPAHGVLPTEFITDKGSEWTGHMSDAFVKQTGCTLKTLPTARADWKPTVENGHRLVQDFLRTVEPSFDPDTNSMGRQQMNYGKNASCTLAELTTFVLRYVIQYNRRVLRNYRQELAHVTSDFVASPINLWNDSVAHDAGITEPYTEEEVRFQLLPRERGTVSKIGLVFKGIVYVAPDAEFADACIRARQKSRRVDVSYDPRCVDRVYVHHISKAGPVLASLSNRNLDYEGMSFAEVARIEKRRRDKRRLGETDQLESRITLVEKVKPIVQKAVAETKRVTKGRTLKVRRKDVVDNREAERALERKAQNLVPAAKPSASPKNAAKDQEVHTAEPMAPSVPPARSAVSQATRFAVAPPVKKNNSLLSRINATLSERQQAK